MQLARMAQIVEAEAVPVRWNSEFEVECGFAADLMSDVLSLAKPGSVLVTGLANPQVIRTSEVAGVAVIILARGKRPLAETSLLAREAGIPILCTAMTVFEVCGRLYAAGIRPTGTSYKKAAEAEVERR